MKHAFSFDAVDADLVATVGPLIAERDAMVKRVHEETAHYLSENPSANATTLANEDLTAAVRRANSKIQAAKERIYDRHADALEAARDDEARAMVARLAGRSSRPISNSTDLTRGRAVSTELWA
jgi:hypothetical protein